MKMQKCLSCLGAAALSACALTSCGGGDSSALQVVAANTFVSEDALTAYSDELLAAHPEWAEGETAVEFTALSLGSEESDAAAYGAGIMKVSAMVASGEIDVMICDLENAARNGRSDVYLPLEDFLSEEEMAAYSALALSFDMVDDEGNPTGEQTAACGLSLTGSDALSDIYGESEYGVFIVANTENVEQAKDVALAILES